ncbi:MAG: PIN domain-containing protein [Anaerolineales bacterium]|nr:PIN domain-containing protein [Anaerolineales bacterium]
MNSARYVLDTNIISALLRKEKAAAVCVEQALLANAEFLLCPIVFYELSRGLLYKDAKKQQGFFLRLTANFTWDDLTRQDWEEAAKNWARLREIGRPIGSDADLLIGTFAMRRNAIVVTDNINDFLPLGVSVENWRR